MCGGLDSNCQCKTAVGRAVNQCWSDWGDRLLFTSAAEHFYDRRQGTNTNIETSVPSKAVEVNSEDG